MWKHKQGRNSGFLTLIIIAIALYIFFPDTIKPLLATTSINSTQQLVVDPIPPSPIVATQFNEQPLQPPPGCPEYLNVIITSNLFKIKKIDYYTEGPPGRITSIEYPTQTQFYIDTTKPFEVEYKTKQGYVYTSNFKFADCSGDYSQYNPYTLTIGVDETKDSHIKSDNYPPSAQFYYFKENTITIGGLDDTSSLTRMKI